MQNLASEEHHRSEQDFQDFIRKYQEGEIFPYREQLRKNTGIPRLRSLRSAFLRMRTGSGREGRALPASVRFGLVRSGAAFKRW